MSLQRAGHSAELRAALCSSRIASWFDEGAWKSSRLFFFPWSCAQIKWTNKSKVWSPFSLKLGVSRHPALKIQEKAAKSNGEWTEVCSREKQRRNTGGRGPHSHFRCRRRSEAAQKLTENPRSCRKCHTAWMWALSSQHKPPINNWSREASARGKAQPQSLHKPTTKIKGGRSCGN